MGQNFSSEPVVEKDTERDHNDAFNVAVSSCQGWRTSQEDNHSLMLELPGEHKAAFFAVYDGHGSSIVSKHASEVLWRHIVENENYKKGNFKEALESSFLTFDREVNESYNAQLAGTTAICVLIVNDTVYCANIGDSRAVASIDCSCVPLSYDHKPENPQELKRILAAGGYVLSNRVNGNLALSRAFGDFHYKNNDQLPPEHQIVSPCPDIKTIDLNEDVDFLVLACDGIWDVLTSEEVVEFVISRLEQNMEPGIICEQLTTRCLATDYELVIGCDNMTVLLVCYTRGRSWVDYCTDIFNKNTRRLGEPRTRPSFSDMNQGSELEGATVFTRRKSVQELLDDAVCKYGMSHPTFLDTKGGTSGETTEQQATSSNEQDQEANTESTKQENADTDTIQPEAKECDEEDSSKSIQQPPSSQANDGIQVIEKSCAQTEAEDNKKTDNGVCKLQKEEEQHDTAKQDDESCEEKTQSYSESQDKTECHNVEEEYCAKRDDVEGNGLGSCPVQQEEDEQQGETTGVVIECRLGAPDDSESNGGDNNESSVDDQEQPQEEEPEEEQVREPNHEQVDSSSTSSEVGVES